MEAFISNRFRPFIVALIACILITSCAPSSKLHEVNPGNYLQLQKSVAGRGFEVVLRNGATYKGRKLKVEGDSLFWKSTDGGKIQSATVQEVHRVDVKGTKWVSYILAGSAVAAMILVSVSPSDCHSESCTAEALGYEYAKIYKFVGLGILGGIGWIIGEAFKTDHIYLIESSNPELNNSGS